MDDDAISAEAEGVNEVVDRIVVLTKINVRYTIRPPAGASRDKIDRALASHVAKCPTAQSIKDSVELSWSAEIEEAEPPRSRA